MNSHVNIVVILMLHRKFNWIAVIYSTLILPNHIRKWETIFQEIASTMILDIFEYLMPILYTPSVTQCRSIFNRRFAWKNNRNYHPFGFYLNLIIYPNWRICAESERTSVIQQNINKIKTVITFSDSRADFWEDLFF